MKLKVINQYLEVSCLSLLQIYFSKIEYFKSLFLLNDLMKCPMKFQHSQAFAEDYKANEAPSPNVILLRVRNFKECLKKINSI